MQHGLLRGVDAEMMPLPCCLTTNSEDRRESRAPSFHIIDSKLSTLPELSGPALCPLAITAV